MTATFPYVPEGREAVFVDGEALEALIKELGHLGNHPVTRLRVAVNNEAHTVAFKVNEGIWSPPYPQEPDPKRTH